MSGGSEAQSSGESPAVQPQDNQARVPAGLSAPLVWIATMDLARRVSERFGPSSIVLAGILWFAHAFTKQGTKDEFFRAVMFGEKGAILPGIVFLLVVDVVVWAYLDRRRKTGDSSEMQRLIDERNRLQEELLQRKLSHTRQDA